MAAMTAQAIDAFLAQARIAKLSYLRGDGSPTVIPIWFEWDGKEARVFTSRGSAKLKHISRDPRVALSVETATGETEAWVTIEGDAIVEGGGWELAQRLAARYYSAEKSASTLESWEANSSDWVTIRIAPRHVRSLAS